MPGNTPLLICPLTPVHSGFALSIPEHPPHDPRVPPVPAVLRKPPPRAFPPPPCPAARVAASLCSEACGVLRVEDVDVEVRRRGRNRRAVEQRLALDRIPIRPNHALRRARAGRGHPRVKALAARKAWMAGT